MINPLGLIFALFGRLLELASPRYKPPSAPARVGRHGSSNRRPEAVRADQQLSNR
jgi:hypothetical protein